MFRKKKQVGSVTVLDDDALNDDAHRDLLLDKPPPGPSDAEMERMTSEQLQAVVQATAQSGKDATTRALRTALEAREVGVETAATMQAQTAQLEKMSEDIEVVHDHLDRSEQLIEKMTKSKVARMFQRKKATGKGLDKVRASKKEKKEREELRGKGLDAVDVGAMQRAGDDAVALDDLQRDELFGDAAAASSSSGGGKRALFGRKKNADAGPVDPRKVQEDYRDYDPAVANVLRDQDKDLDQISDALADMRALAGAMNNELEYQDKMITEVKEFTAETSRRTKQNAKKIATIK